MSDELFVLPDDVSLEFPFWVDEEEDGSLTINWDPNHKITSVFNDWTAENFINMLTSSAKDIIASHSDKINQ